MFKYIPKNIPYEHTVVARQPIFDRENEVWAFELLYRTSWEDNTSDCPSPDEATMLVSTSGFLQQANLMGSSQRVSINFTPKLIVDLAPEALPAESVIIEVVDYTIHSRQVLDALKKLKAGGYTIALDDYTSAIEKDEIISLVDIIKIDVMGRDRVELAAMLHRIANKSASTIAKRVDSMDTHELCKRLGFDYFQGYYYAMPHNVRGRKISSGAAAKIDLMNMVQNDCDNIEKIVEHLKFDPSISYRLLRYINSPAFGLSSSVDTLQRASAILGSVKLCKWLSLVLLSDLTPKDKTQELYRRSLERARFFEEMSQHDYLDFPAESCFTFGLLSLLGVLLDMDMADIVEQLPLSQSLKDGYVDENTRLYRFLNLVRMLEQSSVESIGDELNALDVEFKTISQSYLEATLWADTVYGSING